MFDSDAGFHIQIHFPGFSVFLVMQVHTERVHLKVKQHCSFCEKKYSDVKNLLKHMEKRHNLKDTAVQQSYQQLRFELHSVQLCYLAI